MADMTPERARTLATCEWTKAERVEVREFLQDWAGEQEPEEKARALEVRWSSLAVFLALELRGHLVRTAGKGPRDNEGCAGARITEYLEREGIL